MELFYLVCYFVVVPVVALLGISLGAAIVRESCSSSKAASEGTKRKRKSKK